MDKKWIAKITEREEEALRDLLEEANKTDNDSDWQKYMDYMKQLGVQYNFEANKVSIDTNGYVFLLPNETIYIVYNRNTNEIYKAFFNKKDATEYIVDGSNKILNLSFKEIEIQ